jgi:hypothetical protein
MSAGLELLWMLAEHFVLTAAPAVAAVAFAMRRGLRSVPLLLGVALAASGIGAMLVFWGFYASPVVGKTLAFVVAFGSAQAIFLCWRAGLDRDLLRQLATPLALWGLASAFVLYLGFLHGGSGEPLVTPMERFSTPLPPDNAIPSYFSDWFFAHGSAGTPPPFIDWLSSDRPPLQIGYVLAQRPFGWDHSGLHYQVLGVILQQLWIVGMWALLCAARLSPRARGLTIFAAIVSDVTIVHGFFVWPKLLAAAFLFGALALVLSQDWPRLRGDLRAGALLGALCGLAMLAHGASAFAIVPLLALAALRGRPSWRWLGVAILSGAVLLAPWSAYQRFADPPGDRLLKWQLAGSLAIDGRGTVETIVDSYRDAGFDETVDHKLNNASAVIGWDLTEGAVQNAAEEIPDGHLGMAVRELRTPRFYSLLASLGLLVLCLPAMLLARVRGRPEGPEWSFAVWSLGFCGLACVFWVLLMFGSPESTSVIHQGTLALPVLALSACVAGAFAVFPRVTVALVVANVVTVLLLYTPSLTPPPGTSYSIVAGLLATASLAGIGFVALRQPRQGSRPGTAIHSRAR